MCEVIMSAHLLELGFGHDLMHAADCCSECLFVCELVGKIMTMFVCLFVCSDELWSMGVLPPSPPPGTQLQPVDISFQNHSALVRLRHLFILCSFLNAVA